MSDYQINNQIVKMYTEDGLSVDEIAKCLGLDVGAVWMVLAQRSRRELGERYDKVLSELDKYRELAIATLGELMRTSTSDAVRADCAKVVLEYITGNKEPKRLINSDVSAFDLNNIIKEAQISYVKALTSRLGSKKAEEYLKNRDAIDIEDGEQQR
jgi:transposase-like protein